MFNARFTGAWDRLRFCRRTKMLFVFSFRVAYWKLHCYAVRLKFRAATWIALVGLVCIIFPGYGKLITFDMMIYSFFFRQFHSHSVHSRVNLFSRFSFTLLRFYSENKSIVELIVALYVLCLSIGSCQNGQNAIITIPTTKYRIKRDR